MKDGFEIIALGDLCELKYGNSLPERKRILGDIPVYGSNGIVGYHNQSVTEGETIIVGRKGSIGEVHYSRAPCFPIDTTYYISETNRACDLKWLYYALRSLGLSELNKSSAVPGLNRNDAYEKRIIFPPLPIQKQIAAILEKADRAREKRREATQLTEQFLQSAFLEMFGDPVTNPKDWEISPIGDVADVKSGFAFKSQDYQKRGIRLVRIANFSDSSLRFSEDSVLLPNQYAKEYEEFLVKERDVLIAMSGATTGKIGFVAKEDLPCLLNQRVGRFSIVNEEKLNASYLFHFLLRPSVKKRILDLAGGSAQPNVSRSQLKMLRIPLPPINEQQKFAALVEKVESLHAKQRESERELENLFNSLMQRAFRGELLSLEGEPL